MSNKIWTLEPIPNGKKNSETPSRVMEFYGNTNGTAMNNNNTSTLSKTIINTSDDIIKITHTTTTSQETNPIHNRPTSATQTTDASSLASEAYLSNSLRDGSTTHKYNGTQENDSQYGGSSIKLVSTTPDEQDRDNGMVLSRLKARRTHTLEANQNYTHLGLSGIRTFILCLSMSLGWGNSVRLPREALNGGLPFIVAYGILLVILGAPLVLLQVALGQFCRQSAHRIHRASPAFKGAELLRCVCCWLVIITVGFQGALTTLHLVTSATGTVPFKPCTKLRIGDDGYKTDGINGQTCIQNFFLTPPWENLMWFGYLSLIALVLASVVLLITRSTPAVRWILLLLVPVSLSFLFAILALTLLSGDISIGRNYINTTTTWRWDELGQGSTWAGALLQVLYSTNLGFGVLPIITGRFLYKGDAVRTSTMIVLTTIITGALSIFVFLVISSGVPSPSVYYSEERVVPIKELWPISELYDFVVLGEHTNWEGHVFLSVGYAWMLSAILITMITLSYALFSVMSHGQACFVAILGLATLLGGLLTSEAEMLTLLDSTVAPIGTCVAIIVQTASLVFVYGHSRLQSDLEFSIGRPLWRGWCFLCGLFVPVAIAILIWYFATREAGPASWGTAVSAVVICLMCLAHEVNRQDDYNFIQKFQSACRPSLEWGPEDPVIRHSWKLWGASSNGDHGERDFTLRRRGTRDYTHSVRKNYTTVSPVLQNPKKDGSIYDSAIEEDISLSTKYKKYRAPVLPTAYDNFGGQFEEGKTQPNGRKTSIENERGLQNGINSGITLSNDISRIHISGLRRNSSNKNPLAQNGFDKNYGTTESPYNGNGYNGLRNGPYVIADSDHICWRRDSSENTTDL